MIDLLPAPENTCKGQVYKCRVSDYTDSKNNDYTHKVSMVLAKKKSCRGCEHCGWLDMREEISCGNLLLPVNPENGSYYELIVTNVTTDWESGLPDGYDLEFKPIVD